MDVVVVVVHALVPFSLVVIYSVRVFVVRWIVGRFGQGRISRVSPSTGGNGGGRM